MQTRTKFFIIFAAILAMTATANAQQTFAPNEKGEVNALTLEVRSLMERADKVIIETVQDRLEADQKVAEAANELKKIVASSKATPLGIFRAKMGYVNATGNIISARRPAYSATHKAAMAYFDNVIAITKAHLKLATNNYGEWQEKTLAVTKIDLPPEYKTLMGEADKALESARERDEKLFRQFQDDFEQMQKRDREMREKISK
jgi:hypothetical protein